MTRASAVDLLRRKTVEASVWGTSYQLSVVHQGETVYSESGGVDGLARPVANDSLYPIYCAGKPIMALVVGRLVDMGELSFDDRVGDVLPEITSESLRTASVESVLGHCAGFARVGTGSLLTMDAESRRKHVLDTDVRPVGRRPLYSEVEAWQVLAYLVEALTGESFDRSCSELILQPCGLSGDVVLRGLDCEESKRLRCSVDMTRTRPRPVQFEDIMDAGDWWMPATGFRASMEGLCLLYEVVARSLKGSGEISAATARALVEPFSERLFDEGVGRVASYSRGFMVALDDHGFSAQHSQTAVGHSGLSGMTFAAHDPELQVSYAVHINGITAFDGQFDADRSPWLRRKAVTDRILADVRAAVSGVTC